MGDVRDSAMLRAQGLSQKQIERLVRSGRLYRVERGVFTTAPPEGELLLRALCHRRPHLVFTGRTALEVREGAAITLPVQCLVPEGKSVHCGPQMTVQRRRKVRYQVVRGLRVALRAAAVADATDVPDEVLIRCLESEFTGHRGKRWLESEVGHLSRIPARFHALVSRAAIGADSEAERMVARALLARGFEVEQNVRIGNYYFDCLLRKAKVIVEIDGYRYHSAENLETFVRDRWKANHAVRQGYRVLRYSGSCVTHHLAQLVEQIIAAVEGREEMPVVESLPVWEWHHVMTREPPWRDQVAE